MKKLILVLFFLGLVSASCSSGQIDINTATLSELDQLSGIGSVKAQAIIDTRLFSSVDDLIKVYGIGEVTLEKIKTQGLACVDSEIEEEEVIKKPDSPSKEEFIQQVQDYIPSVQETPIENIPIETIKLSPQNIKTEKSNEELSGSGKYAVYGLIIFCVLLFGLFISKKIKIKKDKNEFN